MLKGTTHTPETRARMSAAQMGNQNTKGHTRTPEARAKMSAAHAGNTSRRTHGHGSPMSLTYLTWRNMKTRCLNPRHEGYGNWGGRGITICDRWLNSFENFLADMGEKPEGLSLDRIDNDGNYGPDNCRWATWSEQNLNRRAFGEA